MTEEENQGAQKRQSKRFKVSWPSRVLFPDKRIVAARLKDVSVGGVGLEIIENLPVGTEVSIEFTAWVSGRENVIRAKCVTTYSMIMSGNSGFSCGMRFAMIPPEHLAELKKILKQLD